MSTYRLLTGLDAGGVRYEAGDLISTLAGDVLARLLAQGALELVSSFPQPRIGFNGGVMEALADGSISLTPASGKGVTIAGGIAGMGDGALQAIVAAIAPAGGPVTVAGAQALSADFTIPVNVALTLPSGKPIALAGHTLTIAGPLSAGPYQIFGGAGTVALGKGTVHRVYLEWWGGGPNATAAANSAALAAAVTAAAGCGATIELLGGVYLFGAAQAIPANVDVEGQGREATTMRWTAATNGLTAGGANAHQGQVRNLTLDGNGVGLDGYAVTSADLVNPQNVCIRGWTQRGLYASQCDVTRLVGCLFQANGSATYAQVEIDQGTTLYWQSYISGGNTGCVGGLRINRTNVALIDGGASAIESTGTPILIQDMAQGTAPVTLLRIDGIDLENPGNGNPYISLGVGWTGAAGGAVTQAIIHYSGSPSGTATVPEGILAANCTGVHVLPCAFGTASGLSSACNINLSGTGNAQWTVDAGSGGLGVNHVHVNGADTGAVSARPWVLDGTYTVLAYGGGLTGATPSVAGGSYFRTNNATATTVTNLLGGVDGQEIVIVGNDVNTTLGHAAGGTGQLHLFGGATRALVNGTSVKFVNVAGSFWSQEGS